LASSTVAALRPLPWALSGIALLVRKGV